MSEHPVEASEVDHAKDIFDVVFPSCDVEATSATTPDGNMAACSPSVPLNLNFAAKVSNRTVTGLVSLPRPRPRDVSPCVFETVNPHFLMLS